MVAVLKLFMALAPNNSLSVCVPNAPKMTADAPMSEAIFFMALSYVRFGSNMCYIYDDNSTYS